MLALVKSRVQFMAQQAASQNEPQQAKDNLQDASEDQEKRHENKLDQAEGERSDGDTKVENVQRKAHSKLSSKHKSTTILQQLPKKQKRDRRLVKRKDEVPSYIDEDDDEVSIKAKEEFLQAMRMMEEAGLVTEKGIGAGMVK